MACRVERAFMVIRLADIALIPAFPQRGKVTLPNR